MIPVDLANLAVAALIGLAVGIEREWSGHAAGPGARFAGVRTFLLLGLLGGVAGWLTNLSLTPLAAILLAGGAALAVVAYAVTAHHAGKGADGTTEAAALVVLALGTLAGAGYLVPATASGAVAVLALMEKERMHALVRELDERELRSALQFAALALGVLPLLPTDSYGPWGGVRPRQLWILVLLFSGLNYVSYIARRVLGANRGYGATGALGGVVSSTAVSLTFARKAREQPALSTSLAVGAIAASVVLIPKLALMTAVLNGAVSRALLPYLVPPFLAGALAIAITVRSDARSREPAGADHEVQNPLRLGSAIRMALVFQLALWLVAIVRERWGSTGTLVSAVLLGLTDMDAITISMSHLGTDAELAALGGLGIAVGMLTNTVVKFGLVVVLGSPRMRKLGGLGLAAIGVAAAAAIWFLNRGGVPSP